MHDRRLALQGRRNREDRGANRPPPNIFVGIKAKTSQTWNATFPPPLDFQTFLRPCFAR